MDEQQLGKLQIVIGGNTAPLDQSVLSAQATIAKLKPVAADAAKSLSMMAAGTKSSADGATDLAGKLVGLVGKAGLLGLLATGAYEGAKQLAGMGDNLLEIAGNAKRAGLDLQEYQAQQKAAFQAGGLSADKFAEGTDAIAAKLTEAAHTETTLGKLFDENNKKLKDGTGAVIGTNEALRIASDLVRGIASEQEKIKIAQAFGLGKEWVPVLQAGRAEMDRLADAAKKAGGFIDNEMVAKAAAFKKAWRDATSDADTMFAAWAQTATTYIKQVYEAKTKAEAAAAAGPTSGKTPSFLESMTNALASESAGSASTLDTVVKVGEILTRDKETAAELNRELARGAGLAGVTPGALDKPTPTKTDSLYGDDKDKQIERRFDAIRQMLANEGDAISVQEERITKDLDKALEKRIASQEQYNTLRQQLQMKSQDQLGDLMFTKFQADWATEDKLQEVKFTKQLADLRRFENDKTDVTFDYEQARRKIIEKNALDLTQIQAKQWSGLAGIVDTSMGQISQIVADEGNKGFTVMKGIAAATALVKGYEAAVSAYAFGAKLGGPPLGAAMAGIALAGTAAYIAKLAGVGPSSSGTPTDSGGGGASASTTATSASAAAVDTSSMLHVHLNGSGRYSQDEVRNLIEQIAQFQSDGSAGSGSRTIVVE